jgi:hypothetical protein
LCVFQKQKILRVKMPDFDTGLRIGCFKKVGNSQKGVRQYVGKIEKTCGADGKIDKPATFWTGRNP